MFRLHLFFFIQPVFWVAVISFWRTTRTFSHSSLYSFNFFFILTFFLSYFFGSYQRNGFFNAKKDWVCPLWCFGECFFYFEPILLVLWGSFLLIPIFSSLISLRWDGSYILMVLSFPMKKMMSNLTSGTMCFQAF